MGTATHSFCGYFVCLFVFYADVRDLNSGLYGSPINHLLSLKLTVMPLEGVVYRHTKEQQMGNGGHERRRMSPVDPLHELVFTALTKTLWPIATSGRKADSGLRFPRRMSPRYQESMAE